MTYEAQTIQDRFHNASSERRAAERAHVSRNGDVSCDRWIVVNDHVLGHWVSAAGSLARGRADVHSSAFSTLFSMASAGLPNTALQTCVWIDMSAGRKRVSRFGALDADSFRQAINSRTRVPIRYPSVFSLTLSVHWPESTLRSTKSVPAFEIIDTTDPLLRILYDL